MASSDQSLATRPTSLPGILSSTNLVILTLVIFRLSNAFAIKTFFQPDEYFQSLEPAWKIVFGPNSGAWITWEWREQLRSSIHPLLFAGAYRLADQISNTIEADSIVRSALLLGAPKALQALFAAAGDYYTWKLASKIHGHGSATAWVTLAITVSSPWQWFCSVRTLSNSLETTLTILGLCYWPWSWFVTQSSTGKTSGLASSPSGLYLSLTSAAIACVLRPTNIMIWATVAIASLYHSGDARKVFALLRAAILCGSAVLAVSIASDRTYYGEWTFPPLKFLYVNLVQSLAVFYGQNRVDYYFTEGIPLLLTTALPFAVVGLYQALRPAPKPSTTQQQTRSILATTILSTILALTAISHKEVRFIYPLLPLLHILASAPLLAFFRSHSRARVLLLPLLLLANLLIATYVSTTHQRGVIDVLHHLRSSHDPTSIVERSRPDVAFLMPCHSTPWRSHLIHPLLSAWALTCEPPLGIPPTERGGYMDEADVFYADPINWVNANVGRREGRDWPEKFVFFEALQETVGELLKVKGYAECWRGFNTHWHDDGRREGDVIVWCHASEERDCVVS